MSTSSGKNSLYWINTAISLFFMFIFGRIITPVEPLTAAGVQVLGIFIGLIWAWSTVDMAWPSIVGFIALGFSDYTTVATAFTAGFGNYATVLLVVFCMAYGAYLNDTGLNKSIAYWFLTRKICIGRPWVLTAMILIASFVLGFCVSAFAAVIMMWNIFYNICDMVGFKKTDKYVGLMVVGIVLAVDLGIMPLPYKPVPVIIINGLQNTLGIEMNIAKFAVLKTAMAVPALALFFLAIRYIFKPDVSKLHTDVDLFAQYRGVKKTTEQKIAIVSLIVFFFSMFFPGFAPKTNVIAAFLNKIGTTGCVALMIAILCAVPYKGKKLADYHNVIVKGVNWNVIILLAVTIPLGTALSSKDTGIMAWVSQLLQPVFANATPLTFALLFLVGGLLLTQIAHNIALANLLLPIMLTFGVQIGADPECLSVLLSFALAMAIASPASSPMGALLFGNTEYVSIKHCYLYTWVFVLILAVCMMCIGYPLGNILF